MPVRSSNGLRTARRGSSSCPPHGPSSDTVPPICSLDADGAAELSLGGAALVGGAAEVEALGAVVAPPPVQALTSIAAASAKPPARVAVARVAFMVVLLLDASL